MRVSLFTDGIHPYVIGGMQTYALNVVRYLIKDGFAVDLYHFKSTNLGIPLSDLFTEEEQRHLRVFESNFPKFMRLPGHYLRESKQYSKQLFELWLPTKDEVDFVLTQGFCGGHYLDQKSKGVALPPVAINYHGLNMFQPASSKFAELQMKGMRKPVIDHARKADVVFTFGGQIREIYRQNGISDNKLVNISNALGPEWPAENINTESVNPRSFIFIGRYEKLKGIELLLEVLKELQAEVVEFSFHIVGDMPEQVKYESSQVHFHGTQIVDDLKSLLAASDVLVVPSFSEGMPTVILEAMASGLATIATKVGAIEEQVNDKNGWLIPTGDPVALKQAIKSALEISQADLKAMKENALEHFRDKFRWEKAIEPITQSIRK
jgi:glycosyltransferase involved in cell wall biosynthesis